MMTWVSSKAEIAFSSLTIVLSFSSLFFHSSKDLYGDASVPSGLAGGGDDLTSAAHPLMSAAFTSPQSYRLVKCDSLPGLGSIRDLSLTLLREENELGNEEATSVTVAATGTGSGGGITYLEPRIASRSKRECVRRWKSCRGDEVNADQRRVNLISGSSYLRKAELCPSEMKVGHAGTPKTWPGFYLGHSAF